MTKFALSTLASVLGFALVACGSAYDGASDSVPGFNTTPASEEAEGTPMQHDDVAAPATEATTVAIHSGLSDEQFQGSYVDETRSVDLGTLAVTVQNGWAVIDQIGLQLVTFSNPAGERVTPWMLHSCSLTDAENSFHEDCRAVAHAGEIPLSGYTLFTFPNVGCTVTDGLRLLELRCHADEEMPVGSRVLATIATQSTYVRGTNGFIAPSIAE